MVSLAAAQFSLSNNVTVSAESVDGPTPAVRVTWNTTVPPQCVASVRVDFRTASSGPVVATYTTTNTSETEFIQTGLQCTTYYYITVVITGTASDGKHPTLSSRPVQVFVGGKNCVHEIQLVQQFYVIAQIYLLHLEWKLKSLQTTQVSECFGSGYVRVYSCVLKLFEFTTNLREAL